MGDVRDAFRNADSPWQSSMIHPIWNHAIRIADDINHLLQYGRASQIQNICYSLEEFLPFRRSSSVYMDYIADWCLPPFRKRDLKVCRSLSFCGSWNRKCCLPTWMSHRLPHTSTSAPFSRWDTFRCKALWRFEVGRIQSCDCISFHPNGSCLVSHSAES